MYIYEVKNASKYFEYGILGSFKFPAVDDVNITIDEKPSIYAIAGESGCGKTTLAKMFLRILKADRGTILYRGKNIWKLSGDALKNFYKEVQPVFQDPYDTFNPHENVDNYLIKTAKNLLGLNDEKEVRKRVQDVLDFVGLSYDTIKGKKPREFSGGQLQRVALARSIIPNPKVLIADEPVSMLDASLRINILNFFRDIKNKEKSIIIYITHDLATSYYLSDYIFIMYRGSIVEHGAIQSIVDNPLHPYTQTLLKALPDYRKRDEWFKEEFKPPGIELEEFLIKGCKYANQCPHASERCFKNRPHEIEAEKEHYVACWLAVK
ncbi:MAG: ABC transporter ATP-binding protein [Candidatus Bathyarchaeia archaeon]